MIITTKPCLLINICSYKFPGVYFQFESTYLETGGWKYESTVSFSHPFSRTSLSDSSPKPGFCLDQTKTKVCMCKQCTDICVPLLIQPESPPHLISLFWGYLGRYKLKVKIYNLGTYPHLFGTNLFIRATSHK